MHSILTAEIGRNFHSENTMWLRFILPCWTAADVLAVCHALAAPVVPKVYVQISASSLFRPPSVLFSSSNKHHLRLSERIPSCFVLNQILHTRFATCFACCVRFSAFAQFAVCIRECVKDRK